MREWDVGKKDDLGREREKERERDRGDRNRDREREREHPKESREVDRLERRKRSPDIIHSVSPGKYQTGQHITVHFLILTHLCFRSAKIP